MSPASASSSSSSSAPTRPRRPVHYRFVSIDDEGCPSSSSSCAPDDDGAPEEDPSSSPRLRLLRRFYDGLLVPAFPLDAERDDLDDWVDCFAIQRRVRRRERLREYELEVEKALTLGVGEPGVAEAVRRLAFGGDRDDASEEVEWEGPDMDVILMVQDGLGAAKDDGRHFCRRRRSSLLLRGASSGFAGLYAPNEEEEGSLDADEGGASGVSQIRRRSSHFGGLYGPVAEEEDVEAGLPQQQLCGEQQQQPRMRGGENAEEEKKEGDEDGPLPLEECTVLGGAAIEYYRESRVGLLSYIVLHNDCRGCGLAKHLHEEALARLDALAHRYRTPPNDDDETSNETEPSAPQTAPALRAVFAETNTPAAGDVTPELSLRRHRSLYNLGYRHVQFPYAQPPLATTDVNAAFEDIVLLCYFPYERWQLGEAGEDERAQRFCAWYRERRNGGDEREDANAITMDAGIPFGYVEDFYRSVFGHECAGIPDYHAAEYYKLARWFARERNGGAEGVEVSLRRPTAWEDCKEALRREWNASEREVVAASDA